MKKFKFNLENVLHQREVLEKLAQKKYSDLRKKLRTEESSLEQTKEKMKRAENELLNLQKFEKSKFSLNTLKEYDFHIGHLKRVIGDITGNIELLKLDLENVRQALIHASQNKRIMIKLKDKALLQYGVLLKKEEDKFFDEITTALTNRSRGLENLLPVGEEI